MKKHFYTILLAALSSLPAIAQRNIKFNTFGADSIRLTFNKDYFFIEDSCAKIIRYTRFNFRDRKFIGAFKDVADGNPSLVIGEGNYNDAGQKDGEFSEYYLNGNLLGKGDFKDDKYTGKWVFYFEDGQPQLTFEVRDSSIYIIDAWNDKRKKTLDNGNGTYEVDVFGYKWSGKIIKGRPDGAWLCTSIQNEDEAPIATEHFVNGQFANGKNFSGIYVDSSRFAFINNNMLPMLNAEKLKISAIGCTIPVTSKIISALYDYGNDDFSDQIKQAVGSYIGRLHGHGYITIAGEVNEKGALVDLKNTATYSADLNSKDLIVVLERLPLLNPATVNGKPVKQGFTITFDVNPGLYSFSYRFLPITVASHIASLK